MVDILSSDLMCLLMESNSLISYEKVVESATPEEGEKVLAKQRPSAKEPEEHY